MINTDMRDYDYYVFAGEDEYGQERLSDTPQGSVRMAINVSTQSIKDSIVYKGAEYFGLTHMALNDKYVIQYGEEKLKVLYVNNRGRFIQVFMSRM